MFLKIYYFIALTLLVIMSFEIMLEIYHEDFYIVPIVLLILTSILFLHARKVSTVKISKY